MRLATPQGFKTAEHFFTCLRDTFDVLYAEGETSPKMMSVGTHCRLLGRPRRFRALEHFLDHVQHHDKVWICRRVDIARHCMTSTSQSIGSNFGICGCSYRLHILTRTVRRSNGSQKAIDLREELGVMTNSHEQHV